MVPLPDFGDRNAMNQVGVLVLPVFMDLQINADYFKRPRLGGYNGYENTTKWTVPIN